MSILVDALMTEVLYLRDNPDFITPPSTIAFMEEAADAIGELLEALEIARRFMASVPQSVTVAGDSAIYTADMAIAKYGDKNG